MLRVFILCAERLHTPDDDISDAYCSVTYEGMTALNDVCETSFVVLFGLFKETQTAARLFVERLWT